MYDPFYRFFFTNNFSNIKNTRTKLAAYQRDPGDYAYRGIGYDSPNL